MKNLFPAVFFFCFSSLLYPQYKVTEIDQNQERIEINLKFDAAQYKIINKSGNTIIDYYEYDDPSKPGYPKLPHHALVFAIPPMSKASAKISKKYTQEIKGVIPSAQSGIKKTSDSTYEKIPQALAATAFLDDRFPSEELEIMGYTWIRDYYCVIIHFNSHQFDWRSRKIFYTDSAKVILAFEMPRNSFSFKRPQSEYDEELSKLIINYRQANDFRSRPNYLFDPKQSEWIDYNNEYIKLAISEDGLYRISYSDLINYDVLPSSIDPNTLRLYSKGTEVPIFVSATDDNIFNENDFIEFWAERNYSLRNYRTVVGLREEYLNYLDRYSDTSYVWLTWTGKNGLRMPINDEFVYSNADTVDKHRVFIHLEKDKRLWYYDAVQPRTNLPDYQENKVWTWQNIGNSGVSSFKFFSDNFVADDSIKIISRIISNGAGGIQSNAHRVGSSLNLATPQDTIIFDYKQTVNFETQLSTNDMKDGENIVRLFGMPTTASFHQALIDWVDIEYPRYNVAQNDSITIRILDNLYPGERIISVSNIQSETNDLSIYKIKPTFCKITNFHFQESAEKTLLFSDSIKGDEEYYVVKQSFIKKPRFVVKKKFINLSKADRKADYIIITHPSLAQSVDAYNKFISEKYDVTTAVIYVTDIFDEFNYGHTNSESIREFMRSAYLYWNPPAPSYLLLIGDANYDYKDVVEPAPIVRKKNLVPSYGMPVSDQWYVMFDSSVINIPQMFVGRIPAENDDQVIFYLNKHKEYLNRNFDEWNKFYLLFSGGDPNKENELNQIRNANQFIADNIIAPTPIGGIYNHFYKTISPPSNYGPFPQESVAEAIKKGGMFISYIGHSGTQTWDNGIVGVDDLKNDFNNRNPLITDFGCSTGRFAEPDVNAFGETFICNSEAGQAIAYLGNSSFGYLSTSLMFPKLFYETLLFDSVSTIGKAHVSAKMKMLNKYGISEVSRVFNYCNLFFGDPIISFPLPSKPNYLINKDSISLEKNPVDTDDSLQVQLTIINLGKAIIDSLLVSIRDEMNSSVIFQKDQYISSPSNSYEYYFSIPIYERVGNHRLIIELDKNNSVEELSENDNHAQIEFTVYSTNLRALEKDNYYNTRKEKILLLNPVQRNEIDEKIILRLADNKNLDGAIEFEKSFDTLYTIFELDQNVGNKRYWWKSKLNNSSNWSETYSFNNSIEHFTWAVDSSFQPEDLQSDAIIFDSNNSLWSLADREIEIKVTSAGSNEGKFASIVYDGIEQLTNTFFWGIATAELDSITMKPVNIKYFVYPSTSSAPALINYIESLPSGTKLIMVVCDDAAQSVLGSSGGTAVRNSIKKLGSYYIDSLRYRESWCLIGEKGAEIGSVIESYSKLFEGPAVSSIQKKIKSSNGSLIFPKIGKSAGWQSVHVNQITPGNAILEIIPLGIKNNGETDTLSNLSFTNSAAIIDTLDHNIYPEIKILIRMSSNDLGESPQIKLIAVDYNPPPELGINYQTISVENDTIIQGSANKVKFYVYNAGETLARRFEVKLDLIAPDNTAKVLKIFQVDSLKSLERIYFEYDHQLVPEEGYGAFSFSVNIDHNSKLLELFEDNNYYKIPFYVKKDSVVNVSQNIFVNVTFNGNDIFDGDYVDPNPLISVELRNTADVMGIDTSSFAAYLDGIKIRNDLIQTLSMDVDNIKYDYKPSLKDGQHIFQILSRDRAGVLSQSPLYEKLFLVSDELKIFDCFNYPNPMRNITHFTFKLTRLPDEIKIKIYSISGRLLKVIQKNSGELKTDFNKIEWNGRDEDGDYLGNGVYLYKVIAEVGEKSVSSTQKLAVVR